MQTASTTPTGRCENVTVTTATGRVYDLGSPESRLFKLRLAIYRMQRKLHG